ncbi:MAG: hypothetical protein ACFB9M_09725 [Myxococcota bacterium]
MAAVLFGLLGFGCGESNGNSDGEPTGNADGGTLDGGVAGMSDGGSSGPDPIFVGVTLEEGSRWTFSFATVRTQSAQGSGSSSESSGVFEIGLGPPTTIDGQTAYALNFEVLAGPASEVENLLRWTHVAADAEGRLLGSTDGIGLEAIYGGLTGGGFFANFGDGEVVAAPTVFEGTFSTIQGFVVSQGTGSGGCEVLLGLRFCEDSSNSFNQSEYFARGLGPVAFSRRTSSFDSGGGFTTSFSNEINIELVDASFTAEDTGFVPSPWRILPDLPELAFPSQVVGVADRLYAVSKSGGIFVYEPGMRSWDFVRAFDVSVGDLFSATAVEGRVVIFADDEDAQFTPCPDLTVVFDPSDDSLTAGAPTPSGLGLPCTAGPPATVELDIQDVPPELAVFIGGDATNRFFYGYSASIDEWFRFPSEILGAIGAVRTTDVFGAPISPFCSVGSSGPWIVSTFEISENNSRRSRVVAFNLTAPEFQFIELVPGCGNAFVSAAPALFQFSPSTPSNVSTPMLYDFDTGSLQALPPNIIPRSGRFTATRFGDRAALIGGSSGGETVRTIETLDLDRFLP